jgi:hypothetical protein
MRSAIDGEAGAHSCRWPHTAPRVFVRRRGGVRRGSGRRAEDSPRSRTGGGGEGTSSGERSRMVQARAVCFLEQVPRCAALA